MQKLHFLVIDDEAAIGECLSMIITLSGHMNTYFSNPMAAVAAFEKDPFAYHGIFTDLRMPEMNGDEVIARIRNIHKEIPIVIVTATEIINYQKNDLVPFNIQKIIPKPFDMKEIECMIKLFEEHFIRTIHYTPLVEKFILS